MELPPKEIELVQLQFSEEERDVSSSVDWLYSSGLNPVTKLYDSFEKRTKIRLNKFIRERTLVKKYVFIELNIVSLVTM